MSPELERYLAASLKKLSDRGITASATKELPYGVQLKLTGNGLACAVNLYYSKKKGLSAVPSGGDRSLLDEVTTLLVDNPPDGRLSIRGIRVGTDEAGKGDYFGPLVAAAVSCGEDECRQLLEMGTGDSKRLSRGKVRELYEKITEMEGIVYSVCSIPPLEYNGLFAGFQSRGMNSLDMLARAHGIAIDGILKKGAMPANIIIDRFCDMKRLKPWLPATNARIELLVRAEDREVSVAAASIIARSVYLEELESLSNRFGVELSPGAGESIDHTGQNLVVLNGENSLVHTAKVHFVNTLRITHRA
jgi:ribonuclease HIII